MNDINSYITQNLAKIEPAVHDIMNGVTPEIIMLCRFGSHLYGTDTPDSDTDYKGIFIPTKNMILMGDIPKSINNNQRKPKGQKNTKDDVDFELYSLHYFIEMACDGDTAAMDMLHVNKENLLISSDVWNKIAEQRSMFYTKNLSAFVRYARRQAAKYGIKGSRLNVAKEFVRVLSEERDHSMKLKVVWDKLPITVHSQYVETNPNGVRQYQICGKVLQETVTLEYAQKVILLFHQNMVSVPRKQQPMKVLTGRLYHMLSGQRIK